MKQKFLRRILLLALALMMILASLIACDAAPAGGMAPGSSSMDSSAGGMEGGSLDNALASGSNGEYDRKIIRTVTMSCETKAYDEAITLVMTTLQAHGGYVESSETTGTGYENVKNSARRATYTLRIPSERLDAFLETLRISEGIRILNQNSTSDEITAAYYDVVSRLETLEAEKASLTAMLEGFTDYSNIQSMLQVQERLYDVIEEIEALRTKLNLYNGQVAFSTVHLSLREVITYTEAEETEPTFGQRVKEAFVASWTAFGKGCQNFAVWFVGAFPTLLVLGAIAFAVCTIIKYSKKRRAARKAAKSPQAPTPFHPSNKQ